MMFAGLKRSLAARVNMGTGRLPVAGLLAGLCLALLAVAVLALGTGAFPIGWREVLAILGSGAGLDLGPEISEQQANVLLSIRLPRVVLAVLAGAGLAAAGAALQGLFRNPLADPGLVGVSGGAALGASLMIVMGAAWFPGLTRWLGGLALPLAAFCGGLAATLAVHRLAGRRECALPESLVLAGIAITALAEAAIGLLTYFADDQQLRTLTFWRLGSLANAAWPLLAPVALLVVPALAMLVRRAAALNALVLGEAEAGHIGVDVGRLKAEVMLWSALAVGALVAVCGMIGFVGLVAPHLFRLLAGPDHRLLLPGAALVGAILLTAADIGARTLAAPAELPIGILTSLFGGPFFLWLLARRQRESGWVS
jgi:iron complex transport system permease protein